MKAPGFALMLLAPLTVGCYSHGERPKPVSETGVEISMMQTAKGTFTVSMKPESEGQMMGGLSFGRFTNEKVFSGDLEGNSRGTMLTVMTTVEGSAGYVLVERVEGVLGGKRGSFALQHSSTVERGAQKQSIIVVPDSADGELVGLSGSMVVDISSTSHGYVFNYSLPGDQ